MNFEIVRKLKTNIPQSVFHDSMTATTLTKTILLLCSLENKVKHCLVTKLKQT